jgi:hypothetical protein
MNFNETAVATRTASANNIFGKKISFATFLLMNKTVEIKESKKQRLPFLESQGGMTVWFGKSVKALYADNGDVAFSNELGANPTQYEIGLLLKGRDGVALTEEMWVLYRKSDNAATTVATLTMDETTGAIKVGNLKP